MTAEMPPLRGTPWHEAFTDHLYDQLMVTRFTDRIHMTDHEAALLHAMSHCSDYKPIACKECQRYHLHLIQTSTHVANFSLCDVGLMNTNQSPMFFRCSYFKAIEDGKVPKCLGDMLHRFGFVREIDHHNFSLVL